MQPYYPFPADFLWGCATASYQVEGAAHVDGRGPSVWDVFAMQPGRIANDDTGEVAVDQYHRYREDVQLMRWLGLRAYRFSVSWSRVFPDGHGCMNAKGMDYYERLVDELLANGIEPWMTLFHWDLPQALEDTYGGWEARRTSELFAEYAGAVTHRLGDRVRSFFTINEFACFTDSAYGPRPPFAPGRTVDRKTLNQIRHHALLGHGLAVQAIRAHAARPPRVGLAENASICVPVIENDDHIDAARIAMRELNRHFLTAVLEGAYPDTYLQEEDRHAPDIAAGDMQIIGAPLDFVGLNMYAPTYIRATTEARGFAVVPHPESYPRLHMPWLYFGPQITYWGPRLVKEIWDVEQVYITENGCAAADRPAQDGEIYDTDRLMYLRNHFISAHRCVSEGWPLRGYFVWSLLDNFEWAYGYSKRFGITYVNYRTLKRTPKLSAKFYREVIAANGVV